MPEMAWVVRLVDSPAWDVVDGWIYVSLSHWGMFRTSAKNLIKLENAFHVE